MAKLPKISNISSVIKAIQSFEFNPTKPPKQLAIGPGYNPDLVPMYTSPEHVPNLPLREKIKMVNRWYAGRRYGYEPMPLNLTEEQFIQALRQRALQHNTFVRGVHDTDFENLRKINKILEQNGIEPSRKNRLKYFATRLAPETGAGRAGFVDDEHPRLAPIHVLRKGDGTLYLSNSFSLAGGYAQAKHHGEKDGSIFVVRRPVNVQSDDFREIIYNSEFPLLGFRKSERQYYAELPYFLRTGRSLNSDISRLHRMRYGPNYGKLIQDGVQMELNAPFSINPDLIPELKKLGIDIGYIEEALQSKNPKSVYKALYRMGNIDNLKEIRFLKSLDDTSTKQRVSIMEPGTNEVSFIDLAEVDQMFLTPRKYTDTSQFLSDAFDILNSDLALRRLAPDRFNFSIELSGFKDGQLEYAIIPNKRWLKDKVPIEYGSMSIDKLKSIAIEQLQSKVNDILKDSSISKDLDKKFGRFVQLVILKDIKEKNTRIRKRIITDV